MSVFMQLNCCNSMILEAMLDFFFFLSINFVFNRFSLLSSSNFEISNATILPRIIAFRENSAVSNSLNKCRLGV